MTRRTTAGSNTIVSDEWTVRKVHDDVLNIFLRIGEQPFKEVHAASDKSLAGTAKIVEITSHIDLVEMYFGAENLLKLTEQICKRAKFTAYAIYVVPSVVHIP